MKPAKNKGMQKCMKVAIHVSLIWSCCPSALNPEVGPNVESEAGEPASPIIEAAVIKIIIAGVEYPILRVSGT